MLLINKKKRSWKLKIFAFWISFLMVFNPGLTARLVFAEDLGNTETTEGAVEVVETTESTEETTGNSETTGNTEGTENETPEITEITENTEGTEGDLGDAEGEAAISTGDAEALAEVDTTANINADCVPGEITTGEGDCLPPAGETDCPDETVILNDNLADVSDEASSSATTGNTEAESVPGDVSLTTGDATAGADLENQVNTNVVTLEGESEDDDGEDGEDGEGELLVGNQNDGTLTNDADVLAGTGENTANDNGGDVVISTGDALAWANLLNFLNTNIVGSNFEFVFIDLLEGQLEAGESDVNLNEIWRQILARKETDELGEIEEAEFAQLELKILNFNQAVLENNVDVSAGTGENTANDNGGDAEIASGDAAALANVVNFVNTNILGSEFLFFIINILQNYDGDLILPRPEYFMGDQRDDSTDEGSTPAAIFANQNQADLTSQIAALAETGNNQEASNSGDQTVTTGDAQSMANSLSFINLNIWQNNWFILIINVLGSWGGEIFGWNSPGAAESSGEGSQTFELGLGQSQMPGPSAGPAGEPTTIFANQNEATVSNQIQTTATTGGNSANGNSGGAIISTGHAASLANLLNFINLNIMGGRWFLGVVNVLGDWSGNLFFAYPDVVVNLSNGSGQVSVGEKTSYTLEYFNQGHDLATDVVIAFELPVGLAYLGDSCGPAPLVSGQSYQWSVGSLAVGEGNRCQVQVQVEPDFSFEEEKLSFWSKIFPVVHAAEGEKGSEVVAVALIGTVDPESDTSNNTASAKTLVYRTVSNEASSEEETESALGQPVLEIAARNNVNQFVYPGDTITFEVELKNTGDGPAFETELIQRLFNGLPNADYGGAVIPIGTMAAGEEVNLTFGIELGNSGLLPAAHYHTLVWLVGKNSEGVETASDPARTDFEIRLKAFSSLIEAQAAEDKKILGTAVACPADDRDILPYVLLFLLSSLWLVEKSKARLAKKASD